jgi:carotenoid cleavage dioxygenase-like enzyme
MIGPAGSGWARAFRDLPREHAFEPLRVEGAIPADLAGTFYKNGPGRVGAFGERYGHWFDGDGAITAVRLAAGRAEGGVRVVDTPGLAKQEREKRRLYGGYNTPFVRPLREAILRDAKNPANTSVLLWQTRLFALCEAGLPFEIDRADLRTAGERDLGGVLKSAFSAHPHDVPARRAFYNFGLQNGPRPRVVAYELPYSGRPRRLGDFVLHHGGPTLMHDFAATPRHLVFFAAPMRMRILDVLLRKKGGMDALEWRSDEGAEIVVMPIDDPAATFRVQTEAFLCEHVANAFEDGRALHVDFTRYADMRALDDYVGGVASGVVRRKLESSICRAVIDLDAKRVRFEPRLAAPCELPRVSPRVDAARHRFVYLGGFSSDEAASTAFFDAVLKLDVERGTVNKFVLGSGLYGSEGLFVPRNGSGAEDDGYLLTMVYDANADASHLAILDAAKPGAPPLARVHFDHAIPPGFHGVFAPAS